MARLPTTTASALDGCGISSTRTRGNSRRDDGRRLVGAAVADHDDVELAGVEPATEGPQRAADAALLVVSGDHHARQDAHGRGMAGCGLAAHGRPPCRRASGAFVVSPVVRRLGRVARVVAIVGVLGLVVAVGRGPVARAPGLGRDQHDPRRLRRTSTDRPAAGQEGTHDYVGSPHESGPGDLRRAAGAPRRLEDRAARRRHACRLTAAADTADPAAIVGAVEDLTDVRVEHLVYCSWDALAQASSHVDGVPVTLVDSGTESVQGDSLLELVAGDDAQGHRQLAVLRSLLDEVLDQEMRKQPWRAYQLVHTVAAGVALDEDWSKGEVRSLAWSVRGLRSQWIGYLTTPRAGADRQSLWQAIREDTGAAWVSQHPDLMLADAVD